MLDQYEKKIRAGKSLERFEASTAVRELLLGIHSVAKKTAFLRSWSEKTVSHDEVLGAIECIRALTCYTVPTTTALDMCGTGGVAARFAGRLNISTMAAFIVSAGGVTVVKHCGSGSSGKTGSLDFLAALGLRDGYGEHTVRRSVRELGLGFVNARSACPHLVNIAEVRRQIPGLTIFNLALPFCNPVFKSKTALTYYVLGVSQFRVASLLARVAHTFADQYTTEHVVWIVAGNGCIDELTLTGSSQIFKVTANGITRCTVTPSALGIRPVPYIQLPLGDAEANAKVFREFVKTGKPYAVRDIVALNAGLGFTITGKTSCIREGYGLARDLIACGEVSRQFEAFTKNFS